MATISPPLRFAGKKAIVLGGTSGIGLATCQQLVQQGAHVIAFSRSQSNCQAAVASIPPDTYAGTLEAYPLDILDRDKLQQALQEKGKDLDYLVAAATGGARAIGPFMEMDMDGFQQSFGKLWGYANAVRYGVPYLKPGSGAIVLVSGSPARKCRPGNVALSCVGGAVENLVRALARELGSQNIRVNGISPGMIDTPMFNAKARTRQPFWPKRRKVIPFRDRERRTKWRRVFCFCSKMNLLPEPYWM